MWKHNSAVSIQTPTFFRSGCLTRRLPSSHRGAVGGEGSSAGERWMGDCWRGKGPSKRFRALGVSPTVARVATCGGGDGLPWGGSGVRASVS